MRREGERRKTSERLLMRAKPCSKVSSWFSSKVEEQKCPLLYNRSHQQLTFTALTPSKTIAELAHSQVARHNGYAQKAFHS